MAPADHVAVTPGPDQTAPAGAVVLASVSSAPPSQIVETMLRAKTGSLDDVAGLVGVVTAGSTVRFAFLDKGTASETALHARQDAVAAALGAFAEAG